MERERTERGKRDENKIKENHAALYSQGTTGAGAGCGGEISTGIGTGLSGRKESVCLVGTGFIWQENRFFW